LPAPEKEDGGVGPAKPRRCRPFSYADAVRRCCDCPQQVWLTSRIALPTDGLAIIGDATKDLRRGSISNAQIIGFNISGS
jgi:hypothetical protein